MARVEVRQLRYRGEPAKAGRVEHAVTDALRTEVVDDGRLVLVRRFRLGRIGLTERGASRVTASAWQAIRQGARHGGASGAESANCVWFADAAEARVLLLRELASGRTPFAWFWTLAVPDWRRATLGQWLGYRLEAAALDGSGEALAALVADAVAADCIEPLTVEIVARIPPVPAAAVLAASGEGQAREQGEAAEPSSEVLVGRVEDAADRAVASAIVRSVPAPLRTVFAALAARSEFAGFVEALARGLARRAHPALALAPDRMTAIAAAAVRILRFGEPLARAETPLPAATSGNAPEDEAEAALRDPPSSISGWPSPAPRAPVAAEGEPPIEVPPTSAEPVSAEFSRAELRSAAAGLFLAIVPLLRLGWREWLIERPHLLLYQPGPRLLRRIAGHYRVPASDALWSHLPPVEVADDAAADLEPALRLWRAGLDGWLRRKARLRLADLVLRQGWILPGVETTLVRFPLEAIEIRLRRLALDGDPGWVDWLGHSYRLVYRDRPLLGTELA